LKKNSGFRVKKAFPKNFLLLCDGCDV